MPISPIVLQRRLREVGRIRIGEQREGTRQDGSTYTRPAKLDVFRFTSRDEKAIRAAAGLFGGTAEAWEHPRDGAQWQVKTTTNAVDVVVPPPDVALSQWLELWSGGGCQRRCDGVREVLSDKACLCDTEDRDRACTPHTRLSVALPDLESFGLWRLDTQGWNAAAELPGATEIASVFADRGVRFLPARLLLETRSDLVEIKGKTQTVRFAVPVLDLGVSFRQVAALSGGGTLELGAAPLPELQAGPGFTPVPAGLPEAPRGDLHEQIATVGTTASDAPGRKNAAEPIRPTGLKPRGVTAAPVEIVDVPDGTEDDTPPPEADETAKRRAQSVAIWCRDAGLDDTGRHRFLHAYSGGNYDSAKDVPADDVPGIRAAIVRLKRGELVLTERDDGRAVLVEKTLGWESTDPGAQHRRNGPLVVPDAALAPDPDPNAVAVDEAAETPDWVALLDGARGVGEVKLLNRARKIAHDLKIPGAIETLDDLLDPALVTQLVAWLDERRAA